MHTQSPDRKIDWNSFEWAIAARFPMEYGM